MDLQLQGKVALITGSSKGIGRKIAETLAREGCNIGICARNREEVDAAVKDLTAFGVKVFGDVVDVTDAATYKAWFDNCAEKLGGIDIFVPNVSYGGMDASEEAWQKNFEFDLLATWRGVEAAMPYLEKSGAAAIVMISSTAAIETFGGAPSYGAMKAGVLNYAGNLALQLAGKGIRVNAVSPGPVFIEGGDWDKIKQAMPEVYESTLAAIPIGRMGAAADVANQVALLVSPLAGYTTGTNVVIDGGFTKRLQY
jgi:3-oxoacyl-[acyl-carrier protein] reductase